MTFLTTFTGPLPVLDGTSDTSWEEPNTLVGGYIEMSPFAYDLYMAMEPLQFAEDGLNYPLAHYCMAITTMFNDIDLAVRQGETVIIMDPHTVPVPGIPWLGQFVGIDIQTNWDPSFQRSQLHNRTGFARGSPRGMAEAAMPFLTGTQTVHIYEQYGNDPWRVHVVTETAETPNASLVLKALMSQKPAGIVLTHQVTSLETYDAAAALHATYTALAAAHPDYNSLGS